jgi:hypothetical protein
MKNTPAADYHHKLVHECTHVWQYQHLGYSYTADSLWAQATSDAYNWEAEFGQGHGRWQDFNPEAAAAFVEEVWERGRFGQAMGDGVFYIDDPIGTNVSFTDPAGTDFTPFARVSIAYMRGFTATRASGGL